MARTLEKHCLTRVKGGLVKKAASCTKDGLLLLMKNLCTTATTPTDSQDATLVCLMWHVFSRASDLSHVLKQGLSVSANNIIFLRLIRVKTSEEKGLSLFPDRETFETCPVHAIAVALFMQSAPCISLLPQHTSTKVLAEPATPASIPLLELLGGGCHVEANINQEKAFKSATARAPGVHSYVNRILRKSSEAAGVESELTSRSFKRGGAQHSEDQRIARVLSGWSANEHVPAAELCVFDSRTREKAPRVQALIFSTCSNLSSSSYNVDQRVLDHCTAYLIRHYPRLISLSSSTPAVKRLEECMLATKCQVVDLMTWLMKLNEVVPVAEEIGNETSNKFDQKKHEKNQTTIKFQAAVTSGLIDLNKC